MVRKIPVRKYRGKTKDPLGLIARRNAEACINSAPKNPKEQEIPKSILEIKRLCDIAKNFKGHSRKNKKKKRLLDSVHLFGKDPKLPGMTKPDSHLPKIVQMPGESKEKFFLRFREATEDVMLEAQLQEKHQMTISRDESGNIKGFENDPNSDGNDVGAKKKKKRKLLKTSTAVSRIEGSQKKKLNKKQRLKLRKKEDQGSDEELPEVDFSMFKDEVRFGEVADRPPQLTAPRGSDSVNSRPGVRNLLLKDMMKQSSAGDKIGKSSFGKKKNILSASQREKQEQNRLAAVAAYRQIKAGRIKGQTL